MNSEKQDNMLSLAMNSTKEEREQSKILSVGIEEQSNRWEVIVKYHGNLGQIANEEVWVETLIAGYAIVTLPAFLLPALADLEEVEYIEKPKSLIYGLYEAKQNSCVLPVSVPVKLRMFSITIRVILYVTVIISLWKNCRVIISF